MSATHKGQRPDNNQQAIERSWHKLLKSGENIIALCHARRWSQARQLLASRVEFSQQHFQRFPVGPSTKHFYNNRLGYLFDIEQLLEALQSEYARHLRPSPQPVLTLVQ